MVQGQNQQSRNDKATEFQGGTVHLCDSTNAIADSATTITSNTSTTTADADWNVTHDNTAGTSTLTNANDIDMGSPTGYTIDQIVIESTATAGNFIIDDTPTGDTDLSGDGSTTISAGSLTYTLGAE